MARSARLIVALLCLLVVSGGRCRADNPFGLMLWPAGGTDLSMLAARAVGVGVGWYRPPAVFVDRWQTGQRCAVCTALAASGLHLALTVRTDGRDGPLHKPSAPPGDSDAYRRTLRDIIATWRPAVVVIEHEENLPRFYSGSPATYARQLTIACDVAHEQGAACTNGGLSSDAAAAVAWLDLLEQGKSDQACEFARHSFYTESDDEAGKSLCAYRSAADLPADRRARLLQNADRLLSVYQSAPLDLVNFHWYSHDAGALAVTAATIRRITGKPVMSNEIGQRPWDVDAALVRPLLRAAVSAGLKVVIWFSVEGANSASLFNDDGSLRPAGREFARQMSGRR